MEITKRGIPPGQKRWRGRCHTCGTEAAALEEELKPQDDYQSARRFARLDCPVCKMNGGLLFYPEKGK